MASLPPSSHFPRLLSPSNPLRTSLKRNMELRVAARVSASYLLNLYPLLSRFVNVIIVKRNRADVICSRHAERRGRECSIRSAQWKNTCEGSRLQKQAYQRFYCYNFYLLLALRERRRWENFILTHFSSSDGRSCRWIRKTLGDSLEASRTSQLDARSTYQSIESFISSEILKRRNGNTVKICKTR